MRTAIIINDNDQPYTNGDVVKGIVDLALNGDTRLVTIDISLRGTASVRLKDYRSTVSHQRYVHGEHTFLRILHPTERPSLRQILKTNRGRACKIPFASTIPDELLPYACNCAGGRCSNRNEQHRYLPPTFNGTRDGAKIAYAIHVHLKLRLADGTSKSVEKEREICIIPSFEAKGSRMEKLRNFVQPPKDMAGAEVTKGSCGRLEAFISGPVDLQLDLHAGWEHAREPSVPIELRYQPSKPSGPPPAIRKATLSLFSTTSLDVAPDQVTSNVSNPRRSRRKATSIHPETIRLRGLAWTRQRWRSASSQPFETPRQQSCNVLTNISTRRCARDDDLPIYSTTLRLPIRLPPDQKKANGYKLLPPSFSSCSISRNYSLQIDISFTASSADNGRWACGRVVPEAVRQVLNRSVLELEVPIHIVYNRPCVESVVYGRDSDTFGGMMKDPWPETLADSPPEEDPPAYSPVMRV